MTDHEADLQIPARAHSAWAPAGGPRHLRRELTLSERAIVVRRRDELSLALAAFMPEEKDAVCAALSAMLSGFRAMRYDDQPDAATTVMILSYVLREYPVWAIKEGCRRIACNEAGLDRRYPPNDSEIHDVVGQVIAPYRQRMHAAEGLLAVPVETEDPRSEPRRSDLPPPQPLPDRPPDTGHAARVAADLASRRSPPVAWEGA